MWAGLIVIAQVAAPGLAAGNDVKLCMALDQIARAERLAACTRITGNAELDKKTVAAAHAALGRLDSDDKNPIGALNAYDQAIALDPGNADHYAARGSAFHILGDDANALADYDKGLGLKPKSARLLTARAATYERQGKLDLALADLDKAIALEPKIAAAYASKAKLYLKQGKRAEALAVLDKAMQKKPGADFYYARAELNRALGNADRELKDLTRLIELEPKGQRGLLDRALLYERQGKFDLALADYDALLALSAGEKFYQDHRAALLAKKAKAEPPKPLKEAAQENCTVYVPAANRTVTVPCAR